MERGEANVGGTRTRSSSRPGRLKHAQLALRLRRLIAAAAVGDPLPTVAALRQEYRVSQATVDRALGQLRREGLIESRRGSGSYVSRPRRLRQIGVFCGFDIIAPYAGEFPRLLLHALQARAAADGNILLRYYLPSLEFAGTPPEERLCALRHDAAQDRLDGLILLGLYTPEPAGLPVPAVALGPLPHVPHRVDRDDAALVRLGVAELARRGCRHIALIGGDAAASGDVEHAAFAAALAEHGLDARPAWEWHAPPGGVDTGIEHALANGRRGFDTVWYACARARPDGVICVDDFDTRGLLAVAAERGLAPGREFLLASHANHGSALPAGPGIIRIEFDPAQFAQRLLEQVTALLDGVPYPTARCRIQPAVVAAERPEFDQPTHA